MFAMHTSNCPGIWPGSSCTGSGPCSWCIMFKHPDIALSLLQQYEAGCCIRSHAFVHAFQHLLNLLLCRYKLTALYAVSAEQKDKVVHAQGA